MSKCSCGNYVFLFPQDTLSSPALIPGETRLNRVDLNDNMFGRAGNATVTNASGPVSVVEREQEVGSSQRNSIITDIDSQTVTSGEENLLENMDSE